VNERHARPVDVERREIDEITKISKNKHHEMKIKITK